MIIIFILLFSSSTLFACPDLAGEYAACKSTTGNSAGSTNMIVKQSVANKITTYVVSAENGETGERDTETYRADRKLNVQVITDPDSGMSMETATLISCEGNTLNIDIDVKFEGGPAGFSKVKVTRNGSELYIDSVYFDGEEEKKDREICL